MWKKIVSSLVGVSLILCGFVGLSRLGEKLPKQEPIEVETVNDVPSRDKGPQGVEGEGLQVVRPQALGHEARAPDQRRQNGAAILLEVSRFHCSCLRLGKMIK